MKEKLSFKAFYPHSPERVWKALTDPQALANWLMPTNFKAQIGLRFRFNGAQPIECVLLSVEEGKSVSYSWGRRGGGIPERRPMDHPAEGWGNRTPSRTRSGP